MDKSKPLTRNEKKAQRLILGQIDNALDMLELHLKRYCNEIAPAFEGKESTSVPMFYISKTVEQIKDGLYNGAGIKRKKESDEENIDPLQERPEGSEPNN
jgi:hypothetical protein